jgi:hypothetical protein
MKDSLNSGAVIKTRQGKAAKANSIVRKAVRSAREGRQPKAYSRVYSRHSRT